jgi:hypothetical protein
MNKRGVIKNAHSGIRILSDNWGNYHLVPDGTKNKTRKFDGNLLRMLALRPLPEGFIDYGFGNYSHLLSFDSATGNVTWVAREPVTVRNIRNGNTEEFPNILQFLNTTVDDWDVKHKFNMVKEEEFSIGPVAHGEYTVWHTSLDMETVAADNINPVQGQQPAKPPQMTPAPTCEVTVQQQPQMQPQPLNQGPNAQVLQPVSLEGYTSQMPALFVPPVTQVPPEQTAENVFGKWL